MTKMEKHCQRCKKPSVESLCAQCSENSKQRKGLREIYVSHKGAYGYRLIAGFNLMGYIDDEWEN